MDVPKEKLQLYSGNEINPIGLKNNTRVIIVTNQTDILNGNFAYVGYFGTAIRRTHDDKGTLLELPNQVLVRPLDQTGNYELYIGRTSHAELTLQDDLVKKIIESPRRINPGDKPIQSPQKSEPQKIDPTKAEPPRTKIKLFSRNQ